MDNRIIKFRVWDNIDYMSSPFTLYDIQNGKIQFVADLPIMQFTGLLDKKGNEIYEMDILKLHNGDPFIGEIKAIVCFEMGAFGIYPLDKERDVFDNKYTGKMLPFCPGYSPEKVEIIGNRFENPELIK